MGRFKRDMDDALSTLRYTYLKTFMHLVAKRNALKAQDKTARQKRDAWFPQTTQQYYQITERDVQLRVARFLTSSTTEQEKMMDEFGWPYRAVQPLLSAYKTNVGRMPFDESSLNARFCSSCSRGRSAVRLVGCMCRIRDGEGRSQRTKPACSRALSLYHDPDSCSLYLVICTFSVLCDSATHCIHQRWRYNKLTSVRLVQLVFALYIFMAI